jgi:hypothetical protein
MALRVLGSSWRRAARAAATAKAAKPEALEAKRGFDVRQCLDAIRKPGMKWN